MRVGDVIHILGQTTDFTQRVESLEVDHKPVLEVGPNDDFGLKVSERAREHDVDHVAEIAEAVVIRVGDGGWIKPHAIRGQ